MIKRIISIISALAVAAPLPLTALAGLVSTPRHAKAQNCTTFTAPVGDSTNKCASTAFVQAGAGSGVFSGRPWCNPRFYGALGNGSHDDLPAINQCINALQTLSGTPIGGGVLLFDPGFYCISGPIVINQISVGSPIIIRGSGGVGATTLTPCAGADINIITLNASWSVLEEINIYGKGILDTSFGATQPALKLGSNCVSCRISHVYVNGGLYAIETLASDSRIDNSYFANAYGNSIVYVHGAVGLTNAGSRWQGNSFDQGCPVSIPASNTIVNAWAGTTGYVTGNIVSIVQGGVTYYIQASTNGTSGGSQPVLKNYGQPITDGGVTWFLMRPRTYFAMNIDSWAQEVFVGGTASDFSGCYSAGLAITNNLGGTAPLLNHFEGLVIGGQEGSAIYMPEGSAFYLRNSEIFGGWGRPGSAPQEPDGILMVSNYAGPSLISGNQIAGSIAGTAGINMLSGSNHVIVGNAFSSNNIGMNIGANLTDFVVNSNSFQDTSSVTINAGTGSHFSVSNNNVHGAAVTDASTGTKKSVAFNDGYGIPIVNNNSGELPTLVAGTVFAAGSADAAATTMFLNSWGNASVIQAQRANGTNSAKTAVTAGDTIIRMGAGGWDGSAYTAVKGAVDIRGAGTWSGTSDPTRIVLATTAISSTTRTDRWIVQDDGGLFSNNAFGGSKGIDTINTNTGYLTGLLVGVQGSISSTTALISGNSTTNSGAQTGTTTYLQIVSADSTIGGVESDAFATFNVLNFRRADGTAASKSQVLANELIGTIGGAGWTSSAAYTSTIADIRFIAAENLTNTANGGLIDVFTIPTGSTTTARAVRVQASGGLSIGATTDPGTGGLFVNGATITLNGLATDATHTDRTVCQDTTSKSLFFGSGAAGICLGTSSARYKRDIVDISAGLADVLKLRPVNFHYLPGYGGEQLQYGFIAEDVIQTVPTLVGLDPEGRPNSVDMLAMVPILVKSIQELKSEVNELRSSSLHPAGDIGINSSNGTRTALGGSR